MKSKLSSTWDVRRLLVFVCLFCMIGVSAGVDWPPASHTPTRSRTPSPLPSSVPSPSPSATPSTTPPPPPSPSAVPSLAPSIIPSVAASPSGFPSASSTPSQAASPASSASASILPSAPPSSIPSASISSFPSVTASTTPSPHSNSTAQPEEKYGTIFVVEVVVPSISGVILIGGVLYFLKKRKQAKNMIPDIKFEEFQEPPAPLLSPAELSEKTIGIFLDGNFVHATFLGRSGKPLVKSAPCMLLYDKLLGAFMYDGNITDESEVALEILRLLGEDEETIEKVTRKWWGSARPMLLSKGSIVLNNQEFTVSEVLAKILVQLFSENAQEIENFDHCLVAVPAFVYFHSHKKNALLESFRIAFGEKVHIDILPQHRFALDPHQHENGSVFVSLTSFGMEVVKKQTDGSMVGSFIDYGTRDVAYKLWKNSKNSWSTVWKKGCDVTWFEKQIHDVEAVIRKHIVDEDAAKTSAVCNVDTSDLEKVMGGYNECIRKIVILSSCGHVIDFSTFSFQTLLNSHTMDSVVKLDKLQLSEFLDLILFRCVDFQSNATV